MPQHQAIKLTECHFILIIKTLKIYLNKQSLLIIKYGFAMKQEVITKAQKHLSKCKYLG